MPTENTAVPLRSARWGALRSEIKEEVGRSPAGGHSRSGVPRRTDRTTTPIALQRRHANHNHPSKRSEIYNLSVYIHS